MKPISIEVSFETRQKVLAARKPYESFDATLNRILSAAIDSAVPDNKRILTRSAKRWPLFTSDAQLREYQREQFINQMRSAGYKDSRKELGEMFDAAHDDDSDTDVRYWTHPMDVHLPTVIDKVMKALARRGQGTTFTYYELIDKACRKMHTLGGAPTSELQEKLFNSPAFMRKVKYVEDTGYFKLKLQKV